MSAQVEIISLDAPVADMRQGWNQTGLVPDYALFPDGRLCDTAIMWKRLQP
jgi:hypothetical protein